ncbi:DUF2357 domain-containing protein [Lysinibacillus sp. FJAT-14222]|uniref:DUF2357 domain-containing protein n=1 Tax=Lysinibacillus sp. FJAT-14222 TaxID=1932366 RepID=UPI0006AF7D7E|nr:DUF2357 domain-containing protein [Lysinibacillus sp. FJAT-14222]KOS63815.1 hypothetical protein AN161_04265 [Lysinibacillus sp. FJAT-14222]
MDVPFKLEFKQHNEKPQEVVKFARNEDELFKLNDSEIPVAKENINLCLSFSSTNLDDRMYFDLLDIVFKDELHEDLSFISPSDEPLQIYDSNDKYTGALIPGYYKVIVVHENQNYYTWLKIIPKQVTTEQWIVMREEVEAELTGLARDILYKRTGTHLNDDSPLPLNLINKIELINSSFNKWRIAFEHVFKNPCYRLKKAYKKVDKSKARLLDQVSLRKMSFDSQANGKGQVYSSENICLYDTLENRWLKFYISGIFKQLTSLFKELDHFLLEIEAAIKKKMKYKNTYMHDLQYHKLLSTKEDLQLHRFKLTSIINDCNKFLNMGWVKELDGLRPLQNSMVVQTDPNYRTIFKFYKDVMVKNYEISLSPEYTYYWKRTDQLYEIWGFIQFIKAFTSEELGYQIQKGWVYSASISNERVFVVPFLKQGTTIELIKDDIQVNLVYDATITKTDVSQLLYTDMSANRPDLRLDFYKEGEYINSIIIDFKYRPLKNIWNNKYRTDVMDQLTMYRDNLHSQQVFSKSFPGNWRSFRAVLEVWAIYPQHKLNEKNGEPRQIRLVELTPKVEQNLFIKTLKDSVDNVIRTWNTFKKIQ